MTTRPVFAFDLDGTLLDARARQVHVLIEAGIALGEPAPDADRFWQFKRNGSTTAQALAQLGLPTASAQRLASWWQAHVEDPEMLRFDRVLPLATAAIESCRVAGLSPRILTARSDARSVLVQLDACGLGRLVDEVRVVSPGDAATAKAAHLTQWGAVAMVGDTESDARAAVLATVPFLAVCCGQRSEAFLCAQSLEVFVDAHSAVTHWLSKRRSND